MSLKRKSTAHDAGANKRNRATESGGNSEARGGYEIKARVDPVTGQRGAFPGLDGSSEADNLFYGPASDGLEYLRMVRAEAQNVPSMLIATPKSDKKESNESWGIKDDMLRRFWADEAIIAAPSQSEDDWSEEGYEEEEGDDDPQGVYYSALLERFHALREQLHSDLLSVSTLPQDQTKQPQISNSTDIAATYRQWFHAFTRIPPTPRFVAGQSQQAIITGLGRVDILLTKRNLNVPSVRANLGAWVWSLLARCRDRSELDGDDTAVLRALAKNAQRLHARLGMNLENASRSSEGPDETEPASDSEGDEADHENMESSLADLETAKSRLLNMVNPDTAQTTDTGHSDADPPSIPKALMLLEGIVTIVGEMHGQRDLLDQRGAW